MQDDIDVWNHLISTVTPLKKTKAKTEIKNDILKKLCILLAIY